MVTLRWHEGDVVRKLRLLRGWTLKDLARVSRVNISVIHRMEIGATKEAKRDTLARLADAFGITARELLDAVPTPIEAHAQPREKAMRDAQFLSLGRARIVDRK